MKPLVVFVLAVMLSGFATYTSATDWLYLETMRGYIDADTMEPLVDGSGLIGGVRFWLRGPPHQYMQVDCRYRTLALLQSGVSQLDPDSRRPRYYERGTKGEVIIDTMCQVAAMANQRYR